MEAQKRYSERVTRRRSPRSRRTLQPEDWGLLASAGLFPMPTAEEIQRERRKARELRASQWWKRKRAKGVCHYCGRKFPPRELTMDHLVPLARGGRSTKGNLVPACKECNTRKKYLLAFEFEPGSGGQAE